MPVGKSYQLRILHISDLHERGLRETERWRRRRVLGDAWLHNLETFRADGAIDIVCFTGDAADWGKPEEYAAATEFFQAMLEKLCVTSDRFFLVPGNHDINRNLHPDIWRSTRDTFSQGDGLTLSRWLCGTGGAPRGADPDGLDRVLERQSGYCAWLVELGRQALNPASHSHGRVGYRIALALPEFPFPVHVIGLDTAWLAGDDSDSQKLWLTDDQIMRHACDEHGRALEGFRLALAHHPLWDLADHARAANLLAEHTDLLLRGHLHDPVMERRSDPDRGLMDLAAGCLYEGHRADRSPNGAQLITVKLDATGRPSSVETWFRTWSEQGHWYDDDSRYQRSRNGRVRWDFPSRTHPKLAGGNPYDFAHPAVPQVSSGARICCGTWPKRSSRAPVCHWSETEGSARVRCCRPSLQRHATWRGR
ncbi:metallophosphoesterase family protein [Methylolobus aquaticus]